MMNDFYEKKDYPPRESRGRVETGVCTIQRRVALTNVVHLEVPEPVVVDKTRPDFRQLQHREAACNGVKN
jgi:hypothetical protein